MRKSELSNEQIFWITIIISFVLLIHNGLEPIFVLAYSLIPILILHFYYRRSLFPLVLYLLIFGALGRYTRYFRQNYASDTLLAIRDFIGYFLAGKNPYNEIAMSQSGPLPFPYLPFSLFWYLPAQILMIDLRFFETLVSALVPISVFLYGYFLRTWRILPIIAVVALTPFLLDLSADGSNDNSAIFLLLTSIVFLAASLKKKKISLGIASAITLGLAAAFKHYLLFYLIFFIPFLWQNKKFLVISSAKYLFYFLATIGLFSLPFVLTSPTGFWRSLFFEMEIGSWYKIWGWNIWVALRDAFGLEYSRNTMWLVRSLGTGGVILGLFRFFKLDKLSKVFVATSVTMLTYLVLSGWTTYAYFTFLIPLLGLGAINIDTDKNEKKMD